MFKVTVVPITPAQKATAKYKVKDGVKEREADRARRKRYEQRRYLTKEELDARNARVMRASRLLAKTRAYMLLGGRCEARIENLDGTFRICGENDIRVLELDHVNNDGKKHRFLGKHALCREVLKNPFDFQLLCANCHARKHAEGKAW